MHNILENIKFINKNKELISASPCFDETYTLRNKKFSAEQKQWAREAFQFNVCPDASDFNFCAKDKCLWWVNLSKIVCKLIDIISILCRF